MKIEPDKDHFRTAFGVAAAATLALSFSTSALAQQGGGRPSAAGGARPMPTLPARAPSTVPGRQFPALPERPAKPEAAENAASAETTVEHTEDGIERTTTVTNKQGTRSGSTTVSHDDEAGTKTVTTTNTGFDGETRSVENTVTKTEDGAVHEQEKVPDDESEELSPPES